MPSQPFEQLPRRAQVHRIRSVALSALADFPLEPTRVTLIDHDHNTTFRVDAADGRRFALRVNVNSGSTPENLDAETAWLSALAADSAVTVPKPLATRGGRLHTAAWCEALKRYLPVLMMSWLPGRGMDDPSPDALQELGRVTARLHEHGERWVLPPGATFPSHADVLVEDPNRIQADHPLLTKERREVVDAALAVAQAQLDTLWSGARAHALHGDLHGGNVKWRHGEIAVFDFDDAVIGVPVLDLGIAAYYLGGTTEQVEHLIHGYGSVRAVPSYRSSQFEAVLAGRNLLLLNEVLATMSPDVRAVRERYVDSTVLKLRAYLETGRYRHDVPGVVHLGW